MKSYLSLANQAVANGDYTLAEQYALQAQLVLAEIPDSEIDGQSITWRETLSQFITQVRATNTSSQVRRQGLFQIPVRHAGVGS
jgi:hypothetical protein